MRCTRLDRRDRVGHGAAGVVLAMDADANTGALADIGHRRVNAARQHAAVRVAENSHTRPCLECRNEQPNSVVGIVLVSVEEMLHVDEYPPALADNEPNGVAHHGDVLVQGGLERLEDVADIGLRHERDHRRMRVQEGPNLQVILDVDARLSSGAEGYELRVHERELRLRPLEELRVLRHRARPATLDEPDSIPIEKPRHGQFVVHREGNALPLGAIAQGCVEDVESIRTTHDVPSSEHEKTPRGCEGLRVDRGRRARK